MVIADPPAPAHGPTAPAAPASPRMWPELPALGAAGAAALLLALVLHAHHLGGLGGLARGGVASLVLFGICGDALAVGLLAPEWRRLAPLFAVAFGAATSGLGLTVLGFVGLPLGVSLWVTLAAGLTASVLVRRRRGAHRGGVGVDRRRLATWSAAVFIVFCIGLIPALRTNSDTIYGENPDAHQVAGIAVLFQHVGPTGTDPALPIDAVPPAWRFRYPIFYPLAAVASVAHLDPIRAFPAMAALLMALAALGFAAVAVGCLGAPAGAGPVIAVVVGLAWVSLHLAWHPYWNQLWGFTLLPYALLFGWRAVVARDRRAGALCILTLVGLGLAYPLAAPYPLVIIAALAVAHGGLPRRPRIGSRRGWALAVLGFLVLGPAFAGALYKLEQGIALLFSSHAHLWRGDILTITPMGMFFGTGGGVLPAIAVMLLAGLGLRALPRRTAVALGLTLAVLLTLDLRFRLDANGGYMDFKHLSFVGTLVLVLAASAVARWIGSGSRRAIAAALLVGAAWFGTALRQDRREALATDQQVLPELFAIRGWADHLPKGASVRVDLPVSGEELWAIYMLADRPVDALHPVTYTTYAYARPGLRADYSLAWRYHPVPALGVRRPLAPQLFAQGPPVFENRQYVLRRIVWPRPPSKYAAIPDTSSTALVEP